MPIFKEMKVEEKHRNNPAGILLGISILAVVLSLLVVGTGCKRGRKKSTQITEAQKEKPCTSTREYVTTVRYLRAHKDYKVREDQARKAADRVSAGCSGAAKRFIRVTSLLAKSNLMAADAIKQGIKFARADEATTRAFIQVFKQAYLRGYLDLDLYQSIKIANQLSTKFRGDVDGARKDFDAMVKFCVGEDGLDLPKPPCALLAARVAKMGERFEKGGVAKQFIKVYRFVRSSKGPSRSTAEALDIAERVVKAGPLSAKNFMLAYRFGVAESGLDLDVPGAVFFAREMANRSWDTGADFRSFSGRMPAARSRKDKGKKAGQKKLKPAKKKNKRKK